MVEEIYPTSNESEVFRKRLAALVDEIRNTEARILVGGNFNARALESGMPQPDSPGTQILEMAVRTGLIVLNTGSTPTFQRPDCECTIPDVQRSSDKRYSKISRPVIISFEVTNGSSQCFAVPQKPTGMNIVKIDVAKFVEALARGENQRQDSGTARRTPTESLTHSTMSHVTAFCNASSPKRKLHPGKLPVYWWTAEIANLRRNCLRLRRTAQRAKGQNEVMLRFAEHKGGEKELSHEINRQKVCCW